MPWLDKLIVVGADKSPAPPPAVAHTKRRPPPTVHQVIVQVRAPSENDPGQITVGHYTVEDGVLELTDEKGKPLEKPIPLPADADAKAVAHKLTGERWLKNRSPFNRRLEYPRTYEA